jgi:micrococcal nuclease
MNYKTLSIILGVILFLAVIGMLLPDDSPKGITGQTIKLIEETTEQEELTINSPPSSDNSESEIIKEETEEPAQEEEKFIVTKIVDGDTVHINRESTRLICIDTPERGEEGYKEASDYLESLILNKEVILEEDISKRDKYNRLLYYIFTKDGRFVNEVMVRQGYAEAYPYYPDTRLCPQIQEAEQQAKEENLGIWYEEPESEEQEQQETGISCSSNIYNCGDFNTHAEAQAVFEACGGASNDVHGLDRDEDGSACETLP